MVLAAWTEWSDCTYFAESTRTQHFEAPPFVVPVAGITVQKTAKFLMSDLTRERPNMRGSNFNQAGKTPAIILGNTSE